MLVNEQIRVKEIHLTGAGGEDLGSMATVDALKLAKKENMDLVCVSLMSSPPPCKLVSKGTAKQQQRKEKPPTSGAMSAGKGKGQQTQQSRQGQKGSSGKPAKLKEIKLTEQIQAHDYETKKKQIEKLLTSRQAVQVIVASKGKDGTNAKQVVERLLTDLSASGKRQTGIQVSGKGAAVVILPL